jgi:hypothetical protein
MPGGKESGAAFDRLKPVLLQEGQQPRCRTVLGQASACLRHSLRPVSACRFMPGSRGDSFILEHSGGQIVFREFTRLNARDSAVVPNTADRAALRSHFAILVPVFPLRSDASIIPGRADSNMPSTPPCQYGVTIRH